MRTKKWITSSFFGADNNFNGCELKIGIAKSVRPTTDWDIEEDGSIRVSGFGVDIIKAFAESLNFTIGYSYCNRGAVHCSSHQDFYLCAVGQQALQIIDIMLSAPFISSEHTFLIPCGEPYTPLEKLILPFEPEVWMWFLIFMGSGIVVIFIIKFTPKRVQVLVFGGGVDTPTLNLFQAFFGIGQIALPDGSFARYLLMMFILFCLVIRTAYQGIMFNFMQADMRKPEVQSIEEMITKNFTFYVSEEVSQRVFDKMEIMNG